MNELSISYDQTKLIFRKSISHLINVPGDNVSRVITRPDFERIIISFQPVPVHRDVRVRMSLCFAWSFRKHNETVIYSDLLQSFGHATVRPEDYEVHYVTGGVLHYMLTGQVAFDGGRTKRIITQQMCGDIVVLRPVYRQMVSASAKQLMCHMLEPDVLKRARIDVIKQSKWMTAIEQHNTT